MPFELPKGWEWCKLNDIVQINGRIGFRGYTKDDLVEIDGAISLSPSNIVNGLMNFSKCTYISWEKYKESPEIIVNDGDILLVKTGSSYGKCALVKGLPKESTINPQFVVIKTLGNIDAQYVTYYLQSSYAVKRYEEFVLGTAIPTFTQVALGNMQIPLPSTVEQKHIVASVKLWTSLIDAIDSEETNIKQAIASAKSKILDLAIHGKLVPQNPNDEPAYAMLKKLGITSDNRPYVQLPDGWATCKISHIAQVTMGQSPEGCTVNPVEGMEFHQGKLAFGDMFLKKSDCYTIQPSKTAKANSIVLCVRAPVGIPNITEREICIGRGLCAIYSTFINEKYLYYKLKTMQGYFEENATGSTFKAISGDIIKKSNIDIPPISEQLRIVSKIEELFSELDNISKMLE